MRQVARHPGLGCAGRGIIATFQLLEDLKLFETYKPDVVLYDVLGRCSLWRVCSTDPRRLRGKSPDRHIRRKDGTICSQQYFQCSAKL